MPTEKYPGVAAFFLASSLSPSQLWMEKTTAALYTVQSASILPILVLSGRNSASHRSGVILRRCDMASSSREIRCPQSLGRRNGRNVPSNKLISSEHSRHRQSRRKRRRELVPVALGLGLLVGDDLRTLAPIQLPCSTPTRPIHLRRASQMNLLRSTRRISLVLGAMVACG